MSFTAIPKSKWAESTRCNRKDALGARCRNTVEHGSGICIVHRHADSYNAAYRNQRYQGD